MGKIKSHDAANGRTSKAAILAAINERIQALLEARSTPETYRLRNELIELNAELVDERERELV